MACRPSGLADQFQFRQLLDQRPRKRCALLGEYHRIGVFQSLGNFFHVRFRLRVNHHLVAGELWIALQRLESILVIIDDGDLHESFSFSDLLRVNRTAHGQLIAVFANPVISSPARNPSSHPSASNFSTERHNRVVPPPTYIPD